MANWRDVSQIERAYETAAKRFPQSEFAILRLLRSSEQFLELCEELADADLALSNVPQNVASISAKRTKEWQDLVDHLVQEIGEALRNV